MSKVGTRLISIVSQPIEVVVVVVLAVVVLIVVFVVIVVVVVVIVIVVGPRYLALNFGQNWVSNS